MAPNYHAGRLMFRKPLTVFGVLFSFLLPPLGFLFDLIGLLRDKRNGARYGGWIFLMVVSIIMTPLIILVLFYGVE